MKQVTIDLDMQTLEMWQALAEDTSEGDLIEMVKQAVLCLADLEYGYNDFDLLGDEPELLPDEMPKVLLKILTTKNPGLKRLH